MHALSRLTHAPAAVTIFALVFLLHGQQNLSFAQPDKVLYWTVTLEDSAMSYYGRDLALLADGTVLVHSVLQRDFEDWDRYSEDLFLTLSPFGETLDLRSWTSGWTTTPRAAVPWRDGVRISSESPDNEGLLGDKDRILRLDPVGDGFERAWRVEGPEVDLDHNTELVDLHVTGDGLGVDTVLAAWTGVTVDAWSNPTTHLWYTWYNTDGQSLGPLWDDTDASPGILEDMMFDPHRLTRRFVSRESGAHYRISQEGDGVPSLDSLYTGNESLDFVQFEDLPGPDYLVLCMNDEWWKVSVFRHNADGEVLWSQVWYDDGFIGASETPLGDVLLLTYNDIVRLDGSTGEVQDSWSLEGQLPTYVRDMLVVDEHSFVLVGYRPYAEHRGHTMYQLVVQYWGPGGGAEEQAASGLPDRFSLSPTYPNPFNATTTVSVTLPQPGPLRITVLDLLGRPVCTLTDGPATAGTHRLAFDASTLPSGTYLLHAVAGAEAQTRRITLVK